MALGIIRTILDIISGWCPISKDAELEVGSVVRNIDLGENKGPLALDDSDVKAEINAISDKDFEDRIKKETGTEVKILNRKVETVESGWRWRHIYEYEIKTASPISGLAIALIIFAIFAGITLLAAVYWSIESTEVKTPWGRISLASLVLVVFLAVIAIMFLRRMLE